MLTIYHGTSLSVPNPIAKIGRRNLDFGQGFYATKIVEQAKSWAMIIAGRKGRNVKPIVNVYEFDVNKARFDGVRFKIFETYNIEWLDYVVVCRKGFDISSDYDIVEGGVANDNVIDTVEDYEKGIITAEQALGQLRYKNINHQICFLNQNIIDSYLKFVECFIVNEDKEELL